MPKDVVCGMDVDEGKSASKGLTSEYGGQTYSFCSAQCKRQFEQEPNRFAATAVSQDRSDRQTGERYIG
jgi:YHS domain-containing protein